MTGNTLEMVARRSYLSAIGGVADACLRAGRENWKSISRRDSRVICTQLRGGCDDASVVNVWGPAGQFAAITEPLRLVKVT